MDVNGIVHGFEDVMGRTSLSVKREWIIHSRQNNPSGGTTLFCVLSFLMFTHWRGRLPLRCRALLDICRASLLRVISLYFERWVLQVYARTNNLHALPRLLRAPATNRVHGGVDPESVWSLLSSSAVVHRHKPYPKLYPHNNILLAKHTLGPMKLFSMLVLGGMYVIIATFTIWICLAEKGRCCTIANTPQRFGSQASMRTSPGISVAVQNQNTALAGVHESTGSQSRRKYAIPEGDLVCRHPGGWETRRGWYTQKV